MTPEEKARAYDEALERARKMMDSKRSVVICKQALETIFPQLCDSDDEKIRKWLVDYFKAVGESWIHRDISPEQIVSYLEKQKEQMQEVEDDLDEEIHRFFDECIDVYEAKLYGSFSEMVIPVDCYELIARHFAEWGKKQS